MSLLAGLGVELPVVAAPMAGGPSTPDLVAAAAGAGALGFLAAGYRSVDELAALVEQATARTRTFGVNLFTPGPESTAIEASAWAAYRDQLADEAERRGVELPVAPVEDDDAFEAKVSWLAAHPVPVVSFTFGLPDTDQVEALHRAGSVLVATITSPQEAEQAQDRGLDALVVQARCAGGHSGTWYPSRPVADVPLPELVAAVREVVDLPLWGAGGVWRPDQTRAVLAAGAEAVQVGTALLRTPEAGTSATYRAGLVATAHAPTVLTRAFSGRPAGAVRNDFVDRWDAVAPAGYPAVHHLTSPLRKAATAAGDFGGINLWGGPGHGHTTSEPAALVLRRLAPR